MRALAAEITREKLFNRLHQELPYQATVETESWKELRGGDVRIEQTIYVERESQRKIVLGKGGATIKAIGAEARKEIAEMAEQKVHLFLFVKVREGLGRRSGALPRDGDRVSEGIAASKRSFCGWKKRRGRRQLTMTGPDSMKRLCALLATIAFACMASPRARRTRRRCRPTSPMSRSWRARPRSTSNDLMAVFGFVWAKLPERVKVYPTENYYYFGFFHNGIRYAGNIRLDASNRDDGKVVFAYFEDTAQWFEDAEVKYRVLDSSHGVSVEKVEPLRLSRDVSGQERDLRAQRPARREAAARSGPTRSISGRSSTSPRSSSICVFNKKLKVFHYVLNESGTVPDQFFSPPQARAHPGRQAHRLCVLPGSSRSAAKS